MPFTRDVKIRFRDAFNGAVLLLAAALWAGPSAVAQSSLHGAVTDPSGAAVPNALIQLRGPAGEKRANTDISGQYSVANLQPGNYVVRAIAKGFTVAQKEVSVSGSTSLDLTLTIEAEAQVVNVQDEANKVNVDPDSNGGALILGEKELAVLPDDPDELEQALQALAGPGAGPNGGQIYIDGFTGGKLPPKASIREVRVNSNPFSPEYDRPGFGRIEILTKPGSDKIRGQAFMQFNNETLNSRSPLLAQSDRPPYRQLFYGLNLSGPVIKNKASFGFDFDRRSIDENAFILATTLDNQFNPVAINQAVLTPQTRTSFVPRFDYSINASNTLVLRYQNTRIGLDKQGIGSFNLDTMGYNETSSENTFQATETAILSPRAINETRFQYMRTNTSYSADSTAAALSVQGAFATGGALIGNSSTLNNRWELSNNTTFTHQTHTFKWGGRIRQSFIDDTSLNNFAGTYSFFGGMGPELDSNNQAIAGTSIELTALERYRRTLLFQSMNLSAAQIRALGGGASQFTLNAGTQLTSVNQFDIGLFVNDDWRIRPNLTLSYGLRYETQTNIRDFSDIAPRIGIAWGIGAAPGKTAKTILRAGFGSFYDRIADNVALQMQRYNGTTQQSYVILNPDTYPTVPTGASLAASQQPQQLQVLFNDIRAPRVYQASVGIERQINRYFKLSSNYIYNRGVHLLRTRDINAPVNGVYPFGDQQLRMLTESTGSSRSNMLMISPNLNYKKIFLFGFYGLSYGQADNEGQPADPYNLRAEWGPSSFADVRHRLLLGTNIPLPWKLNVSPFFIANSGSPYNITTGRDLNGDTFTSERPALLSGVSAAACTGTNQVYESAFGCFNLNPVAGTSIGRNYARGPASVNLNLRLARSWAFGDRGESGLAENGPPPGMGGIRGGGGPGGGGPGGPGGGGPPPGGGPGGGGPGGMFGSSSGKKYNLTLSLNVRNIMNHPNYAAPSGDLSSPYFGEYRSLAGFGPMGAASTYNRKLDIQLRFTF